MSQQSAYLYLLTPCRPDLPETSTPEEQAIIGEHFAYLQQLLAEDKLVLAGRTLDFDPIGLCIFYADSPEQAQEVANNDPAVIKGVMNVTVRPYGIALLKGRD